MQLIVVKTRNEGKCHCRLTQLRLYIFPLTAVPPVTASAFFTLWETGLLLTTALYDGLSAPLFLLLTSQMFLAFFTVFSRFFMDRSCTSFNCSSTTVIRSIMDITLVSSGTYFGSLSNFMAQKLPLNDFTFPSKSLTAPIMSEVCFVSATFIRRNPTSFSG